MLNKIVKCPNCGFNRVIIDDIISPCQNCHDPIIQLTSSPKSEIDLDRDWIDYFEDYANNNSRKTINLFQINVINVNLSAMSDNKNRFKRFLHRLCEGVDV